MWFVIGVTYLVLLHLFVFHILVGAVNLRHWLSESFLIFGKLHLGKQVWVYLLINRERVTLWFFEALIGRHFNEVLAARFVQWLPSFDVTSRWSAIWRRHQVSIFLSNWHLISWKPADYVNLTVHSLLHELVELIDTHVFKLAILSLTHKPAEYFFVSVLLALLVGLIKCIATLLVESC